MTTMFSPALRRYNQLYCLEGQLYHEAAVRLGLSDSQFWTLYALYGAGEALSQREISIGTGMPKQTVHSTVGQMLQAGCLRREEASGRECRLLLTAAGRQLAEETVAFVIRRENEALADFSARERDCLLSLSEQYVQRLGALLADLPRRSKE